MKKIALLSVFIILLAMIPLTYVAARGGRGGSGRSFHRGGHRSSSHYHGGRHYHGRGYYRGGYYNPAWWAIPTAVGIAATAAAASSSDSTPDNTTYYPENYDDTYYEDTVEVAPQPSLKAQEAQKKAANYKNHKAIASDEALIESETETATE